MRVSTLLDFPAESQEGNGTGEHEGYSLQVTPLRFTDVPEVLEVHEVPLSEEVRIVPESPTALLTVCVFECLGNPQFPLTFIEFNNSKRRFKP